MSTRAPLNATTHLGKKKNNADVESSGLLFVCNPVSAISEKLRTLKQQ